MQYTQPQLQFSTIVKQHSTNQVKAWLISWQFKPFDAALLAPALIDRAIAEQINSAPTDMSVLLTERAKIESLVMDAKRIVSQSEQHNRVDALLADLINRSSLLAPDLPVVLEPDAEDDCAKHRLRQRTELNLFGKNNTDIASIVRPVTTATSLSSQWAIKPHAGSTSPSSLC